MKCTTTILTLAGLALTAVMVVALPWTASPTDTLTRNVNSMWNESPARNASMLWNEIPLWHENSLTSSHGGTNT